MVIPECWKKICGTDFLSLHIGTRLIVDLTYEFWHRLDIEKGTKRVRSADPSV